MGSIVASWADTLEIGRARGRQHAGMGGIMRNRIIRTLAVGVGAGALVLGMAAPALAADYNVNEYPAKVVATWNQSVALSYSSPDTNVDVCAPGVWAWTARAVGQKKAVTEVTPTVTCAEGSKVATVTFTTVAQSPFKKDKANVVLKLIATQVLAPDSTETPQKMVFSTVLKVKAPAVAAALNKGQAKKAAS
jgi:hypothetical protein